MPKNHEAAGSYDVAADPVTDKFTVLDLPVGLVVKMGTPRPAGRYSE